MPGCGRERGRSPFNIRMTVDILTEVMNYCVDPLTDFVDGIGSETRPSRRTTDFRHQTRHPFLHARPRAWLRHQHSGVFCHRSITACGGGCWAEGDSSRPALNLPPRRFRKAATTPGLNSLLARRREILLPEGPAVRWLGRGDWCWARRGNGSAVSGRPMGVVGEVRRELRRTRRAGVPGIATVTPPCANHRPVATPQL